jgi:hypothetical protein
MLGLKESPLIIENTLPEFIRKRRNPFYRVSSSAFTLWLCVLLVLLSSFGNLGCKTRGSRVKQQQKAIEKRKAEKHKQQQAIYEKTLDHHQALQGDNGKRRLEEAKEHRKKLDKHQGKPTSWFKRLFTKDQRGCGPGK